MNNSLHSLIVGVDGGGTGCRAAVGTMAHGILGRGEGGRANAATDLPLAIESIKDAVRSAAQQAQISADRLSAATVHIGIAGVLTAQDSVRVAKAMPYNQIRVTDDRPTAVIGALGGADGALLAIGTGTIVAMRTDNDMAFVGGWGFQVSDQGSGAWLGRAALERVLLCYDRLSDHSGLTRALFAKFNDDPNAIAAFAASAAPGDFAVFARDIIAHAKDAGSRPSIWIGSKLFRHKCSVNHATPPLCSIDVRCSIRRPLAIMIGMTNPVSSPRHQ